MHSGHWWEKEEDDSALLSRTSITLANREDAGFRWAPPTEKQLREANRKMRARGSHHAHNRRKNKMPAR
jgi:hypothetical protein